MLKNLEETLKLLSDANIASYGVSHVGSPELVSDDLGFTLTGRIAIKRKDGSFVSYDETKRKIVKENTVITGKEFFMNSSVTKLQPNDIIRIDYDYLQVIGVNTGLELLNLNTATLTHMVEEAGTIIYNKLSCVLENVPKEELSTLFLQNMIKNNEGNKEFINSILQGEIIASSVAKSTVEAINAVKEETEEK